VSGGCVRCHFERIEEKLLIFVVIFRLLHGNHPVPRSIALGRFPNVKGGRIGKVSAGYAGNKKAHQSRRSKFTAGGLIPDY
jgi:hypothetical protein